MRDTNVGIHKYFLSDTALKKTFELATSFAVPSSTTQAVRLGSAVSVGKRGTTRTSTWNLKNQRSRAIASRIFGRLGLRSPAGRGRTKRTRAGPAAEAAPRGCGRFMEKKKKKNKKKKKKKNGRNSKQLVFASSDHGKRHLRENRTRSTASDIGRDYLSGFRGSPPEQEGSQRRLRGGVLDRRWQGILRQSLDPETGAESSAQTGLEGSNLFLDGEGRPSIGGLRTAEGEGFPAERRTLARPSCPVRELRCGTRAKVETLCFQISRFEAHAGDESAGALVQIENFAALPFLPHRTGNSAGGGAGVSSRS